MKIASLILPVFGVILTGWLSGALGYLPRALAGALVQFAYNVAMPALVFVTIAQEPIGALLDIRFIAAFGGGSLVCFAAVFLAASIFGGRTAASGAMLGAAASMTNTGFVALPILQALYGQRGVLPAAIATVFIAVVLFPPVLIVLERERRGDGKGTDPIALAKRILVNPVMISTLFGLVWSLTGTPVPPAFAAYAGIFGEALTPCALFAVGLGLSSEALLGDFTVALLLSVFKLVATPLMVYVLCAGGGLTSFATTAAVVCAAVPTAKTAYVLAGEYHIEETTVASTVSMTTLLSLVTLLGWLYALS